MSMILPTAAILQLYIIHFSIIHQNQELFLMRACSCIRQTLREERSGGLEQA